jgi:hypothetical protein
METTNTQTGETKMLNDMDYVCDNMDKINEAIREADAEVQPILDICTVLEEVGIEIRYED